MLFSFNLHKLVSGSYLFTNAVIYTRSDKLFFALGAVMVILAIVFKIAALSALNPVDKKYRDKFYRLFLTIGVSEVIWYLCRRENVSFFNTPFVAWLVVLIGLIWFLTIVVKTIKYYSEEKTIWEKEQVRQKYLPV